MGSPRRSSAARSTRSRNERGSRSRCASSSGTPSEPGPLVVVNPRVIGESGSEVGREGCLSLPDLTANVRRSTRIAVEASTPEGDTRQIETVGFEARCLLHEIDHLDGILFLDRVDSLATDV